MTEAGYFDPVSVDEVVALLAADDEAKCVAGGASLVAMMNARLVEPSRLVSLRHVEELQKIETAEDGWLQIGALVRHCDVAIADELTDGNQVLSQAASLIANPVIRDMGTIGGSVGHFDPAADYPVALAALGAEIEIASEKGRRRIPVSNFFVDWYETALEPGDLITCIRVPPPPTGSTGIYEKLAKVKGDLGIAMVAVIMAMQGDAVSHLAVSVGGCGPKPIRLPEAEQALIGGSIDEAAIQDLVGKLSTASDPVDDVRASAAYRKLLIPRLVAQAIGQAKVNLRDRS